MTSSGLAGWLAGSQGCLMVKLTFRKDKLLGLHQRQPTLGQHSTMSSHFLIVKQPLTSPLPLPRHPVNSKQNRRVSQEIEEVSDVS